MEAIRYENSEIDERIIRAVTEIGYEEMTPIQQSAIPALLEGRDIIGQAQTGTGKTAAFGIPLVQMIDPEDERVQAIVLCPTRELAIQAADELRRYAKYLPGVNVLPVYGGQEIEKQGMKILCLCPGSDYSGGTGNGASMVLSVSYREFDFLFTGDVEGAGEELLVKSDVLRKYEILKCAHHGSKNSGTAAFLEKTDPRAAIISAGIDNRYGHPHEETLNRLKKRKVKTYNTQTDGAVTIKSDGIQISIESFLLSK